MRYLSTLKLLLRCGLLGVVCLYSSISTGIRDIFNIDQLEFVGHPLTSANIDDLSFVGAIIQYGNSTGFIEDPLGNIHAISLGQSICATKLKVIKILNDQIVVANGQYFAAIK